MVTGHAACSAALKNKLLGKEAHRVLSPEKLVHLQNYLAKLLGKGFGPYAEMNIRRTDLELPDKNIAEVLFIILPGMHSNMLGVLVQKF